MERKIKNLIMLVVGLLLLGLGFYFINNDYVQYGILTFVVDFVYFVFFIFTFINGRNPNRAYEAKIRNTLNTYDSILVRNVEVPNLENRNIIMLYDFEDLVNAQIELRRPICYIKQTESCSFILLDGIEAWVYIEKLNENVVSPVEIEINNMKRVLKKEEEIDQGILKEIEKTTIIKLPNSKSYKISPIRAKENKENNVVKEENEVKEDKSINEETKVTEEIKKEEEVIPKGKEVEVL